MHREGHAHLRHLVITRFNIRTEADVRARPLQLQPDWLSRRFDLFERFCLPSLQAQTSQAFDWLVLFDEATPAAARERIAGYTAWPNFRPVFLPASTPSPARSSVLATLGVHRPQILVTTRLDSDDGVSSTLVERVQRAALRAPARPTVLAFPVGYVFHRERSYLDCQPSNAFSSLVEPVHGRADYPIRTIYTGSHSHQHQLGDVVRLSMAPAWLQAVHGTNLENRRRGLRWPTAALPAWAGRLAGVA